MKAGTGGAGVGGDVTPFIDRGPGPMGPRREGIAVTRWCAPHASRGSLLLALLLVALVLLAGCEPNLGAGVTVRNATNEPLSFVLDMAGGVTSQGPQDLAPSDWQAIFDYVDLASDHSTVGRNGCSTVDVVAYGLDGHEVARHGPAIMELAAAMPAPLGCHRGRACDRRRSHVPPAAPRDVPGTPGRQGTGPRRAWPA
jgi:hypothetical protein